jgi:hypothetical protein
VHREDAGGIALDLDVPQSVQIDPRAAVDATRLSGVGVDLALQDPGAVDRTRMLPAPVMRNGSLIVKGPPWAASLAVLAESTRHSPGRKAGLPPRTRQSSA